MRVRGSWLGVQIVAVVPHHHQAEVLHRREHRGARSEDRSSGAATDCQPSPVALRGAEIGTEYDMVARTDRPIERPVRRRKVTCVGHHGYSTATSGQRRRE